MKLKLAANKNVVVKEHETVPVSYMAHSNLKNIQHDAEELMSLMNDRDDLPQWADEGLTLAKHNLNKALSYVRGQKTEPTSSHFTSKNKKASMNSIHVGSLFDELEKISSAGLELAGLGVLAAPSVKTLMNPKADKKEKSHAKFETAGLGILAAHPAYEIGKKLLTKKAAITTSRSGFNSSSGQIQNKGVSTAWEIPTAAQAGGHGVPSHQPFQGAARAAAQRGMAQKGQAMGEALAKQRLTAALPSAGPVRSAARPATGVMARISNVFRKA